MLQSFRHENHKEARGQPIAVVLVSVLLLLVPIPDLSPHDQVWAQTKPAATGKSSLCSRDNAIEMIKQQVGLTKTFNNTNARITVLIRAADLLWPDEPDKARAIFAEAFELATESEKETAQKRPRSLLRNLEIPDQRYVVIRPVAKRDSAWAKVLTRQMLKAATDNRASSTRGSFNDVLTAERLLDSANQLMATDINAAFDLARASLNYPAGSMLSRFLYRVAETNQQAADQFYAEALAVYGDKPMRELLYLQAYPFAWTETLNTPLFAYYVVPPTFRPNQSLQRRFVQVLLRRAQQALEAPLDEGDIYRNPNGTLMPATVPLLQGLMRLEPQVRTSLPDLWAPVTHVRERILVSLSVEVQKQLVQPGREVSTTADQTFDEQVESAQKVPDVNERDELLATAVLNAAGEKQSLEDTVQAIDKINDSILRVSSLEWLYFHRAALAVNNRRFEEAERLASLVEGQQQRAYLHTEIAKGLLKRSEIQTRGREILDEAISEAKKAGMTIFSARTLLTASILYAKIDLGRSISVLAEAIDCINHIDAPDFHSTDQTLERAVERRGRSGEFKGRYILRFFMPGPDPERAFGELGRIDFDTSLAQSSALTDKLQRAMSILALADVCLQQLPPQPKNKVKKRIAS